jgi:predicted ester cyclase
MILEDSNKALFHRWFGEVWNKGNFDVAYEVIDPEMRVHGAGGQPVKQGPDGVVGLVKTWRAAFPDGQMSIDGLIAQGDLVAASLTWRGTHEGEFYGVPPSGKRVACTSIGIDRITNGKVSDGWGELDMIGMMQQMGAMPATLGTGWVQQGRSPEWPASGGPGGGLPKDDSKDIALRFMDGINSGDDAALAVVTADGYAEYNPVWGATDLASTQKVNAMLRSALPDIEYAVDRDLLIVEGSDVAVHSIVTGTHKGEALFGVEPSGKQVVWSHTDILRTVDGRVAKRWVSADTLTFMQGLGAIPAPGA